MSEEAVETGVETGVPEIDELLVTLESLDEHDVAAHVAVYEQAHDTLRRALETPADPA